MQDRFPLAYSTLGCPDWTLEKAAAEAARHGYRALEVRLLNGEVIPADLSPDQRAEIKATLARHGIGIIGLGLSTRFAFADADGRQANLDLLHRYLELANDLEAPMVRTFGSPGKLDISMDDAIHYVAEALNAAAPAAERLGVTIVLETHDAFCKGADVAKTLAQVSSDRIGAVWDVHHPFRMGEDIETTWRVLGPRIKHIHIKDARRRPDGSWQLVLLGQGEVPCRQVVELLHREGYQGYITAEWEKKWHPEIEGPEVALPQHAQVLREWFAALP
ncbi:MAG TPA: sugar phosphate isomerase/epimerase family protein [Caldilineaceae bacterium]|nr:sugar phosphate isomerase/epimerase family protein [Caldilineaceae bacterium]